ncbi:MAG: DEAD/DEAH box helicase [Verrucomicrobia bacterium]|nr:DEAD/DEAH box helicase [Verrucomicrobiota bacterium]
MTPKLFSDLGLSPEILKAIDKLGFEQASPIQADAIPVLMSGKDVVGQSMTGSGKTAAFAIPAIEKTDPLQRNVQIMILCPTRELAVQVSEEVHKLALFKRGINALPIYGGQSYERQFWGLKQGAQIVIGTPGRVMDHMRRGTLRLDNVKMAILDEADVMLDMGFREDIEFILAALPKERQTVFFSATMPRPIQQLIEKYARDPQSVRIEQKAMTVPTVEQEFYEVNRPFKVELLTRLIDIHDYKLGIVFCNTKRMVDDLVDHLNAQGYSADRLHGDMTQAMRDRVMNKFRKSGLEFLVATDVAARGIDVDDVQVVFNYDLPYDPEDYVHRIGRTGRAGRSGRAISFVSGRELFQIQHIERFTKMRIQRGKIPTANEVEEARASVFVDKVREILQGGKFKPQDHLVGRLLEEGFTSTDIASALIHLLQGDEAPQAARSEDYDRPERAPMRGDARQDRFADRGGRGEQRGFDDRRGDRGGRGGFDDRRERAPMRRPEPSNFRVADVREKQQREAFVPKRVIPPAGAPKTFVPKTVTPKTVTPKPIAPKTVIPKAPEPVKTEKPTAPVSEAAPSEPKKPLPFPDRRPETTVAPKKVAKSTKGTPGDQTRLHMNIGEELGFRPADVVSIIMGETGVPAKHIGTIDMREKHLFVNVTAEHAKAIVSKLNRAQVKNQKLKVKVA